MIPDKKLLIKFHYTSRKINLYEKEHIKSKIKEFARFQQTFTD